MPRLAFLVQDDRCRRRLAVVAGIAAALAAAPLAHADLTRLTPPATAEIAHTDDHAPGPLALLFALRPRATEPLSDVLGPEPQLPDAQATTPLWLSHAWQLGLVMRPAPTTLLSLWLAGSVHQVLGWLAPPPSPSPSTRDRALSQTLGRIAVEPVTGAETSSYGYRRDPFTRRRKLHKGVDYQAPRGTPVVAAGPGTVQVARRKSGYGRVVMIDHGQGVQTRYAHLQRIDVRAGQRVSPGMRIGTVGSTGRATGPHLHFELRIDGEAYDPQQVLGPLLPSQRLADHP